MPAGYSGTPLVRKLGIKAGFKLWVIGPPLNYWDLLGTLPDNVSIGEPGQELFDFIHVFVTDRAQLEEELGELRARIVPAGMIWVSWPKKSSQVASDLSEPIIRDLALKSGLVDVKVCAVDATWSGLKLVIRLRDRPE
jgi:hypothetical protein